MSKRESLGCLLIVILVTSAFTFVGTGVALLAIKFVTVEALTKTCIISIIVAIVTVLITSFAYSKPEDYE